MKKFSLPMIVIAIVAALLGMIMAGMFIKVPAKNSQKVATATILPATFPDVKNDPSYKLFLNKDSIDPTQSVQVGNSNNTSPFNASQ